MRWSMIWMCWWNGCGRRKLTNRSFPLLTKGMSSICGNGWLRKISWSSWDPTRLLCIIPGQEDIILSVFLSKRANKWWPNNRNYLKRKYRSPYVAMWLLSINVSNGSELISSITGMHFYWSLPVPVPISWSRTATSSILLMFRILWDRCVSITVSVLSVGYVPAVIRRIWRRPMSWLLKYWKSWLLSLRKKFSNRCMTIYAGSKLLPKTIWW